MEADRQLGDNASLFARVSGDQHLLAELRRAYRGSGDVLDMLWWREHPLTAGPTGAPDPATAIAALRREAYSRGGAGSPLVSMIDDVTGRAVLVRETEFALRRAEQRVALDAASLTKAIDELTRPAVDPPAALPLSTSAPSPIPLPAVPPRRSRRVVAATIIAAIIVAGALSAVAYGAGRSSSIESARSSPPKFGEPSPVRPPGPATLNLLQTPQRPSDIPPFALDSAIEPSSIHMLLGVQSPTVAVYGGKTTGGLICLVALTTDLRSGETCASKRVFISDGIRLLITTNVPVVAPNGASEFAFYKYYWTGDGYISAGSNQYGFYDAPPPA